MSAVNNHKYKKSLISDGMLLSSQGCIIVPSRNAWFTKSKYAPKHPPTKHLDYDNSGDLEQSLPVLDLTKPRFGFENSEELKSADEDVQKIFSLEFGNTRARKKYHVEEFLSRTRPRGDYSSMEARITRLTVDIRSLIGRCLTFRKDKVCKTRLNNKIQTRRKLLRRLRLVNKSEFERICAALKIVYIPVPEERPPQTFRELSIFAANTESDKIRKAKLLVLEKDLAQKRLEFYKEKEEVLKTIEADLEKMDINGQQMMAEIEDKERRLERWKNTKLYRFLQRFKPVNKKYITMKVQQ